ncbi:MAG TPA: hypothetical protein VID48_07225 [Solirubrobacteraceae bacterium]|jgi:hypothetical protein
MAVDDVQPRLRRALLGIRRGDVDAFVARLANATADREKARSESAELAERLRSAHLALGEAAGWSERLAVGLGEFASLAAGDLPVEDVAGRLGAAVLAVAGEHLVAELRVSLGDPAGELERGTSWNENGRPVSTVVRLGGCVVDCTWQPGVNAGPDTARVVEGLCSAVVCSLAGVAVSRVKRDVVSQLGDGRALARHEALQERLEQPLGVVTVVVDERSMVGHRELYGRVAWTAALADAAGVLERIARAHGGQAYHPSDLEFRLLVPQGAVGDVRDVVDRAVADYEGLVFDVGVVS